MAKKSQDIPWAMSLDGDSISNNQIRRVSIDKFYEIVTGTKHSFKDLCQILPTVIGDVVENVTHRNGVNTVLIELEKLSPNLLKSLYLMAFKKYQGFEEFKL